jgi:proteasome lid subunit RPN8/RPN11
MAKKKNSKKSLKSTPIIENALPQNILSIGERVEEDKNIYISQPVYKEIHKFTQNKTTNESGGMLIGNVIEEFGKTNIIVNGFIEAKYCEATPTTLKFTHETWEYVHKEMDKKFPGQKIVGWIHTHPNFGIFLSEYDKFIQENFFKADYQIAYVVDPIQDIEGFYFWINGKIERCKGFYKFDKMGAKIESDIEFENEDIEQNNSWLNLKNIIIAVLVVCVVFLTFSNISQNKEIDNLQKQQQTLATSANQSLSYMQNQIVLLQLEIAELTDQLKKTSDVVTEDEDTDDKVETEIDSQMSIETQEDKSDKTSSDDTTSSDNEETTSSNTYKNGGN